MDVGGRHAKGLGEFAEALGDEFLRHSRESHDFLEASLHFLVSAGDKDAGCDDGVVALSFEQLLLLLTFEQLLGRVGDRPGKVDLVTHVLNLVESLDEGLLAGVLTDALGSSLE